MSDRNHLTLAEATIAQLAAEILDRCPAALVIASVPSNKDCETRSYSGGSRFARLGMAEVYAFTLKQDIDNETRINRAQRGDEPPSE